MLMKKNSCSYIKAKTNGIPCGSQRSPFLLRQGGKLVVLVWLLLLVVLVVVVMLVKVGKG